MRWIAAVLTLGFFLAVLACSTVFHAPAEPTRQEGPARREGPQFDHAGHLARGVDCAECHGDESVGKKGMPSLEACNQCHTDLDAEKPADQKATAFFGDRGQGKWIHASAQSSEIIFDHGKHAGYEK